MRSDQVKSSVLAGLRPTLPPPKMMHPDIAEVISYCWAQAPDARPAFPSVLVRLQDILRAWTEARQLLQDTTILPTTMTAVYSH
jgi:hypothetical protein